MQVVYAFYFPVQTLYVSDDMHSGNKRHQASRKIRVRYLSGHIHMSLLRPSWPPHFLATLHIDCVIWICNQRTTAISLFVQHFAVRILTLLLTFYSFLSFTFILFLPMLFTLDVSERNMFVRSYERLQSSSSLIMSFFTVKLFLMLFS